LASDSGFTSEVVTAKSIPTASYTLTQPLPSGKWYWRVRSGDSYTAVGLWSQTKSFTVLPPNGAATGGGGGAFPVVYIGGVVTVVAVLGVVVVIIKI
jgi:hypothetical protein